MAKSKKAKANEPALKITVQANTVKIEILKPERLTQHGFGMFLEDAKPGEIQTDEVSLQALLRQQYRSGLRPWEIFHGYIIGFCDTEFPLKELSLHTGEWLREACSIV